MFVLYTYASGMAEGVNWFSTANREIHARARQLPTATPARQLVLNREIAHYEVVKESGRIMQAQAIDYKKKYFDDLRALINT